MKSIIKYISFVALACIFTACQDDFDFRTPGDIPEGTATVVAEVDFMPMAEALSDKAESRAQDTLTTMAPPGDAMNEIADVCIVYYHKNGDFGGIISEFTEPLKVTDQDRTDADADNGISAEAQTKHATLKFDIPLGEYYIYAVANLGDDKGGKHTSTLDVLKSKGDTIHTREGLKSINCVWDASNYRNNREMIGYFTDPKATSESASSRARSRSEITGEPVIRIDTNNKTIHSWLKRVASKVTIEFDASNLRDHISIYIHKATIHHIPRTAMLGAPSAIAKDEDCIVNANGAGHRLIYGLGDDPKRDHKNWPCLTRNNPTITSVAADDGVTLPSHDEKAKALYFYENEQGNYSSHQQKEKFDKRQWPSVTETVKDKEDLYDLIPYGTYIEVEGYYVANSSENQSEGPIKYRFMLGQDTEFDFNATRNCHYKLTMHFRGNANDVDWHIEYDEDVPSIFSPDIYYISYLYNREMSMPFRVNQGSKYTLTNLDAEIICNHWAPEDPYRVIRKQYPTDNDYEFTWNTAYYNEQCLPIPPAQDNEYVNPDVEPIDYNKDIWAGFLSLKKPQGQTILDSINVHNYQGALENFWKDQKIGTREYTVPQTAGTFSYGDDLKEGSYTVEHSDSTYMFNLPFYTRQRQLSPWLAYTGNNPYSYPRKAVVRITATFVDKDGNKTTRSKRVTIQQVERIQNPMGIYRSADNDDPFDVYLMRSDPENLDRFVEIISDGPWRAEIVGDAASWVLLNNGTKTIYGGSGSPIRFQVKPSSKISADRVRNAAIRVYYNNFTCVHLIVLRQGYAPVSLPGSSTKWVTYNLYKKDEFMKSPIGAGSYFRLGNLDQPIKEINNIRPGRGLGQNVNNIELEIAGSDTKVKWNKINAHSDRIVSRINFEDIIIDGNTYRVASYDDYIYLSEHTEKIFGVVYADGATHTATTTEFAYRLLDENNNSSKSEQGMRGVVCYNWNTATGKGGFEQVFFPISASGFGRRKQYIMEGDNRGVLRYGDLKETAELPRVQIFDLCQTPGAMYWLRQGEVRGHFEAGDYLDCFAWDINYYGYAFETYHYNGIGSGGSDALLLKWVQVN